MTQLTLISILVILIIDSIYSVVLTFKITLGTSRIELDCTYAFDKNEKLTGVILSKDRTTFVEFKAGQEKSPTFTSIPGITLVDLPGGCTVTIMNYNSDSMGTYELRLNYTDPKGVAKTSNKRYKVTQKFDKCELTWVINCTMKTLPKKGFEAAFTRDKKTLIVCRSSNKENLGYLVDGKGCNYTKGRKIISDGTFDVLTGTGFSWGSQVKDNKPPANAVLVGTDWLGNIHVGRCNNHDTGSIGKISDDFYYNYNGQEVNDCDKHDILLC